MLTGSVKVTSKGQVTLPKEVRDFLKADVIMFEIEGDKVTIKPVHSVAGTLKAYKKELGDFASIRELAWKRAYDDREI